MSSLKNIINRLLGRPITANKTGSVKEIISNTINVDDLEKQVMLRFVDMADSTLEEIKIPRSEIVGVSSTSDFFTAIAAVAAVGNKQVPVYDGNVDKIVGYINISDVLGYIEDPKGFSIDRITRDIPFFVPNMKIMDAIAKMQAAGSNLAVLVDEFGGVDGLITIDKFIDEIFGDVSGGDHGQGMIAKMPNPNEFVIDAKAGIEDCENAIGVKLLVPLEEGDDAPDIETIGGLVITIAGNVPSVGEVVSHPSGVEFVIMDSNPRRVKKILVKKNNANIR